MKSKFYDFIKTDKNYKGIYGDFSSSTAECLSEDERIEFLRAYSTFLDGKNGMKSGSEKVVGDEEIRRLTELINYDVAPKIRNRLKFDEMNAKVYRQYAEFVGWQFYCGTNVRNGAIKFPDDIIPPVPCAKYEFDAEKFVSFRFCFVLPEKYMDEEKFADKKKPLTTDTGRIIELRKGVTEIVKLQIYRNGEVYARVGKPDPYHHADYKIGDFSFDEKNEINIIFEGEDYRVIFNGRDAGAYRLTNNECPDTLFISGGMHPVCGWEFIPEELVAEGKTITDFFVKATPVKSPVTDLSSVKLPFKIGGEKHKDEAVEFVGNFTYGGGKAVLHIGSIDPCGEVYVNGVKAFAVENFTSKEKDITQFLKSGENELKISVFPRAPEINYSWHRNKDPYIAWLLRDVYIDFLSDVCVRDIVVKTLSVSDKTVTAKISFEVDRPESLTTKIYLAESATGSEICVFEGVAESDFEKEFEISAKSWTCENPQLYTVRVELLRDNAPVDDEIVETGFRTIEQKNGEILLNGDRVLLSGALWMQFLPPYENIVLSHICPTTEEIVAQAAMTKAMNGNVARFHFLGYGNNDPRFAIVCDRMGLMNVWTTRLIDSAETVDTKNGWLAGETYAEQMKEVINHPSIIMWEGSNEFHSSRARLDKMFDEFVTKVKKTDDTRLICPCSHLYYGGGLYGNTGFYYQDDGERDQDFRPAKSSFGWTDESVVRSAHNYEILLGYGNKWDLFRKQAWKSQHALFTSKKHAYIISEFAIVGRQDDTTPECKTYVKNDSYELADEKRAFGSAYDKLDYKLSQAYQALCAYNTVKYMRYLGADGLMWCSLNGGANDASYIKPPIDFYGYAKHAFYALREGFQKTICFNKSVDVIYGNEVIVAPAISGAEKNEIYDVTVTIRDIDGNAVISRKFKVKADNFIIDLEPFGVNLEDGYYVVEYVVEKVK